MRKKGGLLILVLGIASILNAQLVVQPMITNAGPISKTQIWNFSVLNLAQEPINIQIVININERATGLPVLSTTSTGYTLQKGMNLLSEKLLGVINWDYKGSNTIDNFGFLAVGSYRVCYRFFLTKNNQPLQEECINIESEAVAPPKLILPEDKGFIDSEYPQFSWLPPSVLQQFPDLNYDFKLVEIMHNQSPAEAISKNPSIIMQSGLRSNFLVNSSYSNSIDTGKLYAWQVIARNGQSFGGQSEVWTFKRKSEVFKYEKIPVFYARLSKNIYDASYLLTKTIHIEYENNDIEDNSATIELLQQKDGKLIQVSEKNIAITLGQNLIKWDAGLSKKMLSSGEQFILKIKTKKGVQNGCILLSLKD